MSLIVKVKDYELYPEGLFDARIKGLEDLGIKDYKFGQSDVCRIEFEATIKGKPKSVKQIYTKSLHDKSNLRKVVAAILRPEKADFKRGVDLQDLVGRECRVQIVQRPDENGSMRHRVEAVFAPESVVEGEEAVEALSLEE